MGRELRRVPLNFEWPLNKVWQGFLNPLHTATKCAACDGSGYSPQAKHLQDQWYGYVPFRPEDRGSVPFTPEHKAVHALAERNVREAPRLCGSLQQEAERLCRHYNKGWNHHLNADDVAALIAADRLYDFTHVWTQKNGWKPKAPTVVPSPQEVNDWSICGMGHDSINQWVVVKAECERLSIPVNCSVCDGEGGIWPSKEAKDAYEAWEPIKPPVGDGYQIWETVSEGSPISPVFATPEELARHMAGTKWGADDGTPYDVWLKFIYGPGWALSGVMRDGVFQNGVAATVSETSGMGNS